MYLQATDALFSRKVVAATLSRMEKGADVGDALAQFRPMLWQHMLSQMIPGKGVTASSVLVPNLFVRLKATHLRSKMYQVVSAQVRPIALYLRYVSDTSPASSAALFWAAQLLCA